MTERRFESRNSSGTIFLSYYKLNFRVFKNRLWNRAKNCHLIDSIDFLLYQTIFMLVVNYRADYIDK